MNTTPQNQHPNHASSAARCLSVTLSIEFLCAEFYVVGGGVGEETGISEKERENYSCYYLLHALSRIPQRNLCDVRPL